MGIERIENLTWRTERAMISGTLGGLRGATAHGLGVASYVLSPLAAATVIWLGHRDHEHAKNLLLREYEAEVAAQCGKAPSLLDNHDLEDVAKKTPVLEGAMDRLQQIRNVNIGAGLIGMAVGIGLGIVVASMLSGLGAILIGGAISFVGCYITDRVLENFGHQVFHLEDIPIAYVDNNPALQPELSVPGQIRYLERLQSYGKPVTSQQVLTVFVSANPALADHIASRYGAPFGALSPSQRMQVVADLDTRYDLEGHAAALSERRERAQELVFAAHEQKSGVARLESPRVTALEQAQQVLQQQLAVAQEKVHTLNARTTEQARVVGRKVVEKGQQLTEGMWKKAPSFFKKDSANPTPDMPPEPAGAPVPPPVPAPPFVQEPASPPPLSARERVLMSRQIPSEGMAR